MNISPVYSLKAGNVTLSLEAFVSMAMTPTQAHTNASITIPDRKIYFRFTQNETTEKCSIP
jgi:hypothetical protein